MQPLPCPGTSDPQSPLCLTSVSFPCHPKPRYTSLAPEQLEEVHFGTIQLLMHKHKPGLHCAATVSKLLFTMAESNMCVVLRWDGVCEGSRAT